LVTSFIFVSPENGVRLFDVTRKHAEQSATQSFFISGIFGFQGVYHRSEVIAAAGSKGLRVEHFGEYGCGGLEGGATKRSRGMAPATRGRPFQAALALVFAFDKRATDE